MGQGAEKIPNSCFSHEGIYENSEKMLGISIYLYRGKTAFNSCEVDK